MSRLLSVPRPSSTSSSLNTPTMNSERSNLRPKLNTKRTSKVSSPSSRARTITPTSGFSGQSTASPRNNVPEYHRKTAEWEGNRYLKKLASLNV